MEDVKKQRRNSVPPYELGYGRLKFSFRRVSLHLTKYVGRNNRIWCQGLFCQTRWLGYKLDEFFKRKGAMQAILLVTSPFLLDAKLLIIKYTQMTI